MDGRIKRGRPTYLLRGQADAGVMIAGSFDAEGRRRDRCINRSQVFRVTTFQWCVAISLLRKGKRRLQGILHELRHPERASETCLA